MEKVARVVAARLVTIGNSKGIRIPQALIKKYDLQESLLLEETERGLLICNEESDGKLGWEETFRVMAEEREDWSDLDVLVADGVGEDR